MGEALIVIPGVPPVTRRARATVRAGRAAVYSHPATASDLERVAVAARLVGPPVTEGPVSVVIDAVWPRPQSRPAWCSREAWSSGGEVARSSTPDVDNVAKAVMDGLTAAGVWVDDAVVVELTVRKRVAARGHAGTTRVYLSWGS